MYGCAPKIGFSLSEIHAGPFTPESPVLFADHNHEHTDNSQCAGLDYRQHLCTGKSPC